MKSIIHIGYPKTATTWFQEVLFPATIGFQIVNQLDITKHLIQPEKDEFEPGFTKYLTYCSKYSNLILSHEDLIGNVVCRKPIGRYKDQLAKRLHRSFKDAIIVIFLRNQLDLLPSLYSQYVKSGGTYNLKDYLFRSKVNDKPGMKNIFKLELFKYDEAIKIYVELFGKKNVKLYLFEEFISNKKQFVNRFCKDNGLKISSINLDYTEKNIRYMPGIMKIARFSNKFSKSQVPYKNYYYHIPKWFGLSHSIFRTINNKLGRQEYSKIDFLGVDLRNQLSKYYRESNSLLGDFMNLDLKSFGYPI